MSGQFDTTAGALCLDFANTMGDRRRPESERLHDYAALVAFGTQSGQLGRREAATLVRSAQREPAAAETVMRSALELREALYRLLSCHARGRRPAAADLAAVNAAISNALPHLRVERAGAGYAWGWDDAAGSLAAPLRPIARSAADLLTSGDLDRVRQCDGETCTWLFLDTSRNRSRRWCSMESCGNRAKARRHYHRHRSE